MQLKSTQRGDTIIEVFIAFALFGAITVIIMSIMNRAIVSAQRALEINLVRQQIDSQVAAIQYIHKSYVSVFERNKYRTLSGAAAEWPKFKAIAVPKALDFGANDANCPASVPSAFVVTSAGKLQTAHLKTAASDVPYSKLLYSTDGSTYMGSQGIWVQSVTSDDEQPGVGYVDFHIRACWIGPSSERPINIGTIVRLHEPRDY